MTGPVCFNFFIGYIVFLLESIGELLCFFFFQIRYFQDFKAGGALCHILVAVFKFKSDQGW